MAVRMVVEGYPPDESPGMGLNHLYNIPIGQWYLTGREWRTLWIGNGGPSGGDGGSSGGEWRTLWYGNGGPSGGDGGSSGGEWRTLWYGIEDPLVGNGTYYSKIYCIYFSIYLYIFSLQI